MSWFSRFRKVHKGDIFSRRVLAHLDKQLIKEGRTEIKEERELLSRLDHVESLLEHIEGMFKYMEDLSKDFEAYKKLKRGTKVAHRAFSRERLAEFKGLESKMNELENNIIELDRELVHISNLRDELAKHFSAEREIYFKLINQFGAARDKIAKFATVLVNKGYSRGVLGLKTW